MAKKFYPHLWTNLDYWVHKKYYEQKLNIFRIVSGVLGGVVQFYHMADSTCISWGIIFVTQLIKAAEGSSAFITYVLVEWERTISNFCQ